MALSVFVKISLVADIVGLDQRWQRVFIVAVILAIVGLAGTIPSKNRHEILLKSKANCIVGVAKTKIVGGGGVLLCSMFTAAGTSADPAAYRPLQLILLYLQFTDPCCKSNHLCKQFLQQLHVKFLWRLQKLSATFF